MTQTRHWLEDRRSVFARRLAGASALRTVGFVVLAWTLGLWLARFGLYQALPAAAFLGWILAVAAVVWGIRRWKGSADSVRIAALAEAVEHGGVRRRGSVLGVAEWNPTSGLSNPLAQAADTRVATWLAEQGDTSLTAERQRVQHTLTRSFGLLAVGVVLFLAAGPTSPASASFWKPLDAVRRSRLPVTVTVDRAQVRRGERVTAFISAPGRREASLWVRAPGEAWEAQPIVLDTAGRANLTLGPLDSDRYLRVEARGGSSEVVHIRVELPALLSDLQLFVRYPQYLDRADEPIAASDEPLPLPVGSRVVTDGEATVPIREASWIAATDTVTLDIDGRAFSGTLRVTRSGVYELTVVTEAGGGLDQSSPTINVIAVPDSIPQVAIPVPGVDTVAPISLRQPLLIDARDDHGLTHIELVSWRVSRLGNRDADEVVNVPLPVEGTDRAVVQALLDLNERGFLPGDTAFFKVRAIDNSPQRQMGESDVFALRLPSMSELRGELRDESRALGEMADSLAARQEELARELEDLAAERERGTDDQMDFNSVERAQELLDEQQNAVEQAEQLRDALEELDDAAWSAGLTDSEFHKQMEQLQRLLDQALSEELSEKIAALRESLENLDASQVREALRDLAEAAERLREELERNRELYERAALEGQLSTLSDDAEDLAQQQREWNEATEQGTDSAMAATEEALAAEAESLAAELSRLQEMADSMGGSLDQSIENAQQASANMQQAAQQAQQGQQQQAQESGEAASQSLDPLSQELQQQRDQMREQWRQEIMDAMDAALIETVELAQEQESIANQLRSGDTGAEVRGQQAAVREGVDKVMERVQGAAGKNALISPRLGTTLGLSRLRMTQALEQLQRATPNGREAAESADQALDALNAMVYALLQTQGDVQSAESGSGMQEAMEQLAQMAEQQGAMNGETGNMMTMAPSGELMQQLQAMAQREQALAQQLERLDSGGEVGGAEEMAEEAREIARELEAARLDRDLQERQERLFRRLLDAGRSLRNDEEDEREERVSESADPSLVRVPQAGAVTRDTPRYPVPTWAELQGLSPEARRLILDYFRKLNERRP